MGKHGGFSGGMPGNMANLMKQAQRLQAEAQQQEADFQEKEFSGSTGGGAVTVVMNGKKELKSLTLSPEVVDPDDIEMLQDLILAAVNQVSGEIEKEHEAIMSKLAGGLGGFGGLF